MTLVLSRLSEASATCLMCSGRLFRPRCWPVFGSISKPNLVAITTWLLNGEMGHRRRRCCALPVLLTGRKPHNITRGDFLDPAAPNLHPPAAGCDDQGLAERVGVPCGASTGLEGDAGANNTCRVGSLEQRIDAHSARELFRRSLAGRLRTASLDLHGLTPLYLLGTLAACRCPEFREGDSTRLGDRIRMH